MRHRIEVEPDEDDDYWASCPCGYYDGPFASAGEATAAWDEHREDHDS